MPARLLASEVEPGQPRLGLLTAKATFRFAEGRTELETQDPLPIFAADEETPLGLLPRDDLLRSDPAFEVILLGKAHAPGREPIDQMHVALQVGDVRHELMVFGDRIWQGQGEDATIGPAEPFKQMPLTWQRAFGGSCDVLIDVESPVMVADLANRLGRGFDPAPQAEGLCRQLNAPEGFPQFDRTRPLPNVERPDVLIAKWADAPAPACWATVPMDSALHARRALELPEEPKGDEEVVLAAGLYHRAHPDWVIDLPGRGAPVVLEGLSDEGRVSFPLPGLRVAVDYVLGDRSGSDELAPQLLVLLPEERRFYLVYRKVFRFVFRHGAERSARIWLTDGWYAPAAADS